MAFQLGSFFGANVTSSLFSRLVALNFYLSPPGENELLFFLYFLLLIYFNVSKLIHICFLAFI